MMRIHGLGLAAALTVAGAPAQKVIHRAVPPGEVELNAYYTRVDLEPDDPADKVGAHADIVVKVGTDKALVFARDSSYLPCLAVGEKKTYVEELVARKGDGTQKRPDRINKYSYVRIIENRPERVVVHWRYFPDFSRVQWDGVVDEYYTIQPNGNVERIVREGTPNKSDWDDPTNRYVQTFTLTASGIDEVKTTAPRPSRSGSTVVEGVGIRKYQAGNPAARFMFDEGLNHPGDVVTESVSQYGNCTVGGHETVWRKGVSGTCLLFDGYYSNVTLPKDKAPVFDDKITVEAWVALGAYPFHWAPIVHQSIWENQGYYLGIDSYGHAAFMVHAGGTWQKVQASSGTFETDIQLFRWHHVAATYDGAALRLYLDGSEVASQPASGKISLPDRDLVIGLNTDKLKPTSPIRTWATYPSIFGIDGLIDEVTVHKAALSAEDLAASFRRFSPPKPAVAAPDLEQRVLPAHPGGKEAKAFGAAYANLLFHAGFDNMWRVSDHPDIVVQFDKSPARVVFWKGLRYAPALVTENGKWSGDQSAETGDIWGKQMPDDCPKSVGCAEHMSDAQTRHSHVRIIENTPARVVVHWRYAEIDVRYTLTHAEDGWGAWADEYYTIYPDGVCIRHVARAVGGWQETMFYNGPGTRPEDNVELDAYTVVNAAGDQKTYSWAKAPDPYPSIPGDLDIKGGPFVTMVNFKSAYRPYYIYAEGSGISTFCVEVRPDYSRFPWWNHYPVSQAISDGRSAERADRMTHSSLVWGDPKKDCFMIGLTDQPPATLLPLAASWDRAPPMNKASGCALEGYARTERAYKLRADERVFSLGLEGSTEHPIVNPCFLIRGWGGREAAEVRLEGADAVDIRQGTVIDTDGSFVKVIWLELDAVHTPVTFTITKGSG